MIMSSTGEAGIVTAAGAGDAAAKSVPAVHSSAGVERAPHTNGKGCARALSMYHTASNPKFVSAAHFKDPLQNSLLID